MSDNTDATLPPPIPLKTLEGPGVGAPAGVIAEMAVRRLCKSCRHQERSLTLAPEYKLCVHPALPINLVTGRRTFPCVIARGYSELCGYMGARWEFKGG